MSSHSPNTSRHEARHVKKEGFNTACSFPLAQLTKSVPCKYLPK